MSWRNILKNQITQGKQGILTADSPLPKKKKPDDNKCRNILRQWNENAYKIQSKIWSAIQGWKDKRTPSGNVYPEIYFAPRKWIEGLFKKIPEEIACETIKIVNRFYENPIGLTKISLGWDNKLGVVDSGEIDRLFEVMCQYDINGRNSRVTVYGQDNNISHMKVFLWEVTEAQKTVIWRAEVLLVKPAYLKMEEFLFTDEPFENFDIRELDWRKSQ